MSADDSPPRVDPKALLAAVDKALERELKKGPGRALSAYEVIVSNINRIREMKIARFTDAQIVRFLSEIGITVSLGTFANYYSKALAQTGKAIPRKRGRPARDTYDPPSSRPAVPRQPQANPISRPAAPQKPPIPAPSPVLSSVTPRTAPSVQSTTQHQDLMRRIADEGDEVEQQRNARIAPRRKLSRPL